MSKKISENSNSLPYRDVPEGYFENLELKLMEIPDRHTVHRGSLLPGPRFLYPVAAFACVAVMAAILLFVHDGRTGNEDVNQVAESSSIGEEQIEEFLIDSGISVYQLAASQYQ